MKYFHSLFKKEFSISKENYYHKIKSLLFVPGNQEKMLIKSYSINSDVLVPDLEDSVPLKEKINARKLVISHLAKLIKYNEKRLVFPRVNSLTSNLFENDLSEILNEEKITIIKGLVVPKVDSLEHIRSIDSKISNKEKKYKLSLGNIKLIIWIESAKALINMREILNYSNNSRIIGAAFGAEDYCNDMGIDRSDDLKEIEVARCNFAINAMAFNIIPIDTPNIDFKNKEKLEREILYVKKLGFKAKFAIHPNQVEVINANFLPSAEEISWAQKIKDEYENGIEQGRGSISVDSKMVDVPVYKRALNILEKL